MPERDVQIMLIRLDKLIASAGGVSRAEARLLLRQGRVTVDGVPVSDGALKLDPELVRVTADGRELVYAAQHYYMMYKPAGVLSATEDGAGKTVLELMGEEERRMGLFPVGRLDKDAEGLLLLTDDGDFCHRLISPKSGVVKTYFVETETPVSASAPAAFAAGLTLQDGTRCLPAELLLFGEGERRALVKLTEGKFHQVKRMMAAIGSPVTYLKRTAEGGLELDASLRPGEWRSLRPEEREAIFCRIRA